MVGCRDPCPGRHQRRHLGAAVPQFEHQRALARVAGAVDVIVTGDKAFLSLGLNRPRILTARDFLDWNPGPE